MTAAIAPELLIQAPRGLVRVIAEMVHHHTGDIQIGSELIGRCARHHQAKFRRTLADQGQITREWLTPLFVVGLVGGVHPPVFCPLLFLEVFVKLAHVLAEPLPRLLIFRRPSFQVLFVNGVHPNPPQLLLSLNRNAPIKRPRGEISGPRVRQANRERVLAGRQVSLDPLIELCEIELEIVLSAE